MFSKRKCSNLGLALVALAVDYSINMMCYMFYKRCSLRWKVHAGSKHICMVFLAVSNSAPYVDLS